MNQPPAYLALPSPISTNELFANNSGRGSRGRIKTRKYKAWRKLAAGYLMAQGPLPAFVVPVDVRFYVGEVGVGQMDIDNTKKAYLDALVEHRVIKGDNRRWLRSDGGDWVPGLSGAVVEIQAHRHPPEIEHVLADLPRAGRELLT